MRDGSKVIVCGFHLRWRLATSTPLFLVGCGAGRHAEGLGGVEWGNLNTEPSQIGFDAYHSSACRQPSREPVSLSLACLSCSGRKSGGGGGA